MSGGCDGVYSVSRRDSGQRAKDSKNRWQLNLARNVSGTRREGGGRDSTMEEATPTLGENQSAFKHSTPPKAFEKLEADHKIASVPIYQ